MAAKPTRRQLSYLRALANRTGQTFTYPTTSAEASAEIKRLKRHGAELARRGPDRAKADRRRHRPRPRGRGARPARRSHRLRIHRDLEGALMTTPTVTELVRNDNRVGQRVELARYPSGAEQRVLYGQRVNGIVRVTDVPVAPGGRAYLVERDGNAALQALVRDYVLCRRRHSTLSRRSCTRLCRWPSLCQFLFDAPSSRPASAWRRTVGCWRESSACT